jgi:peptide/nickel transport system ATP-binding protein
MGATSPDGTPVLTVSNLTIEFTTPDGTLRAVDGINFEVMPGEIVALVGESGSGKTVTGLSLGRLLPPEPICTVRGGILLEDRDLLALPSDQLRRVRGHEIGFIFQDPLTSLNPLQRIGDQVAEAVVAHKPELGRSEARAAAIDLLDIVGIPNLPISAGAYPHQFSGGMRQRVMIAMAMAHTPKLLVADEPTTALDVTVQAQVLEAITAVRAATNAAVLFITHDMALVAQFADRVAVMYAGRLIEIGSVRDVLTLQSHPYTRALLASAPDLKRTDTRLVSIPGHPADLRALPDGCAFHPRCRYRKDRCSVETPLLQPVDGDHHTVACHLASELGSPTGDERADKARAAILDRSVIALDVRGLKTHLRAGGALFGRGAHLIKAVDGVTFSVTEGSTFGLVGESGCGKSTLARTVVRLLKPTDGEIRLFGHDITRESHRRLRELGTQIQFVFQDPYSSVDPRMRVRDIIAEPLHERGVRARERVSELLALVSLTADHGDRYPHELSGGQRQRVVIARALAQRPAMLVLDEPLSSLDVSIQAQVLNLLLDLQHELGLTYLFISHNLAVVEHVAHTVAVMYLGVIVELGTTEQIMHSPAHPYTQALISAVPSPDPDLNSSRIMLEGDVPSAIDPPSGCRFRTRCWKAQAICAEEDPPLIDRGVGHPVACHFAEVVDIASGVPSPAGAGG